jgi:transcriptional regulator of acetoin/glycerol metabolism
MTLGEAVLIAGNGATTNGASTLAERERQAIIEALAATGGRLAESARRLGISRTTLWRRLRTYGDVPRPGAAP